MYYTFGFVTQCYAQIDIPSSDPCKEEQVHEVFHEASEQYGLVHPLVAELYWFISPVTSPASTSSETSSEPRETAAMEMIIVNEPDEEVKTMYMHEYDLTSSLSSLFAEVRNQLGVEVDLDVTIKVLVHKKKDESVESSSEGENVESEGESVESEGENVVSSSDGENTVSSSEGETASSSDDWLAIYRMFTEPHPDFGMCFWMQTQVGGPNGGFLVTHDDKVMHWEATWTTFRFLNIEEHEVLVLREYVTREPRMHLKLCDKLPADFGIGPCREATDLAFEFISEALKDELDSEVLAWWEASGWEHSESHAVVQVPQLNSDCTICMTPFDNGQEVYLYLCGHGMCDSCWHGLAEVSFDRCVFRCSHRIDARR
jgi:hypothetical protein